VTRVACDELGEPLRFRTPDPGPDLATTVHHLEHLRAKHLAWLTVDLVVDVASEATAEIVQVFCDAVVAVAELGRCSWAGNGPHPHPESWTYVSDAVAALVVLAPRSVDVRWRRRDLAVLIVAPADGEGDAANGIERLLRSLYPADATLRRFLGGSGPLPERCRPHRPGPFVVDTGLEWPQPVPPGLVERLATPRSLTPG
jgi:hypothetical protein